MVSSGQNREPTSPWPSPPQGGDGTRGSGDFEPEDQHVAFALFGKFRDHARADREFARTLARIGQVDAPEIAAQGSIRAIEQYVTKRVRRRRQAAELLVDEGECF